MRMTTAATSVGLLLIVMSPYYALGEERREQSIRLDWRDDPNERAPYYYEDSDGWLRRPGENPHLGADETDGFFIQRTYFPDRHSPLSLVTFVRVRQASGNLKVTVTVRTDRGSSRQMSIRWGGRELAAYHTGTFSEGERDCWVNVLAPPEEGVYELRVTGNDGRPVQVRRITVTGEGDFAFEPKNPVCPQEGRWTY